MFSVAHTQCPLTCNNNVNFSLDSNGEGTILPEMILEGDYTGCGPFEISLLDPATNNPIIPAAAQIDVNCNHVGSYTVEVVDITSNNSCWSTIIIEDKLDACIYDFGVDTLVCRYLPRTASWNLGTEVTLNGNPIQQINEFLDIIPKADLVIGNNTLNFPPSSSSQPLNSVSTLDLVYAQRFITEEEDEYPLRAVLFDVDDSGYLGINDLFTARQLILGMITEVPAKNYLFVPVQYEFPVDFDPYDFTNLDFRNFDFDDSSVTNEDLEFYVYQIGDINTVEDSLGGVSTTTRSEKKILIEDLQVNAGQTYEVPVTIRGEGLNTFGAQVAFDFTNISMDDVESNYAGNVLWSNEVSIEDYRVQLLHNEIQEDWKFVLKFTATTSGKLSDLISLNSDFNNSIANLSQELDLELEFFETSSVKELLDINTTWNGDQLIIGLNQFAEGDLILSTTDGRTLHSQGFEGSEVILSNDAMQVPGLYILSIKSEGNIYAKKIVVL